MKRLMLAACLAALPAAAMAQGTPAPGGARVYFVNLADGDRVKGPVTVVFGLAGMGVAPAEVEKANTGHHHLLINRPPWARASSAPRSSSCRSPPTTTTTAISAAARRR